MENPIDKLFQEKLGRREFEMRPEDWKKAEALIDAHFPARRRRRRWWLLLLLLLGIGGVSYLGLQPATSAPASPVEEEVKTSSRDQLAGVALQEESGTQDPKMPGEAITEEPEIRSGQASSTHSSLQHMAKIEQRTTHAGVSPEPVENAIVEQRPVKLEYEKIAVEAGVEQGVERSPSGIEAGLQTAGITEPGKSEAIKPVRELAQLSPLTPAVEQGAEPEDLIPEPIALPKNKNRGFSLSVAVASLYLPAYTNGGITADAGVAFMAGPELHYRLFPRLGLKTGFFYGRQDKGFVLPGSVSEISYGFSAKRTNYQVTPQVLEFIQIPLSLHWQLGRHGLEGGLAFQRLLGTKGDVVVSESDDASLNADFEVVLSEQSTWIKAPGIRKTNLYAQLGYYWSATPQLAVGAQVQYNMRPANTGALNASANQPSSGEYGILQPWSGGISVRYVLAGRR